MFFRKSKGSVFSYSVCFLFTSLFLFLIIPYVSPFFALSTLWKPSSHLRPALFVSAPVQTLLFGTYPSAIPPYTSCIVLIHGLTPYGAYDPRLQGLASTFARSGIVTFVPHLPALAHYRIQKRTIEHISFVYEHVDALCRQWSLFAISVGAGPAVSALILSNPHTQNLTGLTLFGAYAHACQILGFGLFSPTLPQSKRREIRTLTEFQIREWAQTHHWSVELTETILSSLHHAKTKEDIQNLCRILPYDLKKFFQTISPTRLAPLLPCVSVFILHSRDDPLIPPTDAVRIASAFQNRNCGSTHLFIIPGLTHVDMKHMSRWEKMRYYIFAFSFFSQFRPSSFW